MCVCVCVLVRVCVGACVCEFLNGRPHPKDISTSVIEAEFLSLHIGRYTDMRRYKICQPTRLLSFSKLVSYHLILVNFNIYSFELILLSSYDLPLMSIHLKFVNIACIYFLR
jgi:hypothetical protein